MESDAALIERFLAADDRQALDGLFRRHVNGAYRIARRILRNDAEAEDVVQSAFLAALTGLKSLRTGERFVCWLYGITSRLARKALRSAGAESRRRALAPARPATEEQEQRMDDLEAVFRAVDVLPEQYRLPILLHYCDGLPYEDIGAALEVPTGTVGANIHRGMERLRETLSGADLGLSIAGLSAILAGAGTAEASSRTIEAVSRLVRTASTSGRGPSTLKVSIGVAAGAGLLLLTAVATRPDAPVRSREPSPPARESISRLRSVESAPSVVLPIAAALSGASSPPLPSAAEEQIERDEQRAIDTLRMISTAEADFRGNDRDGNGRNDYWTADVSGLYRLKDPARPQRSIKLIEFSVAAADAVPDLHLPELRPPLPRQERAGYWFCTLPVTSGREGRSLTEFAFAAFPADYGVTGRRTFIINENNVVFGKDLGGFAPEAFPPDNNIRTWQKELPKPPPPAPKESALTPSSPEFWRNVQLRAKTDFDQTLQWARSLKDQDMRDKGLEALSLCLCGLIESRIDIPQAIVLASEIRDPAVRLNAQGEIASYWTVSRPEEALAWALFLPERASPQTAPPAGRLPASSLATFDSREKILQVCIQRWTVNELDASGEPIYPQAKVDAARRWIESASLDEATKRKLRAALPKHP
jgi:RNA polymerase sigma-70 factor (ECF subfamily)